MASYTKNYQLHQWEPEDPFLRTDFNEDLAKIDTALGTLSIGHVARGSYVGDGTDDRTIQLPFAPEFMIIFGHYHFLPQSYYMLLIITEEDSRSISSGSCNGGLAYNPVLSGSTLKIQNAPFNNATGKTVHYIAVR